MLDCQCFFPKPIPQRSLIICLILALAILVAGAVLWWQKEVNREVPQNQAKDEVKTVDITDTNNVDTSDWKTYRNDEYGFEFKMPSGWSIEKTTTPAVFYLKSNNFKPVLLGYNYKNEPFYSYGEFQVNVINNSSDLPVRDRYRQFDDIGSFYAGDSLKYEEFSMAGYDIIRFETHQGFGRNSGEYITASMIKIKNKILQFDYISEEQPDPQVKAILDEVVRSVSD